MSDPKEKNRKIWDARYERAEYFYGMNPNEWLVGKADWLTPGMQVLIPADGEGRNSVWCAEQGLFVDAFDLSGIAVEKAKKLAEKKGVQVNFAESSISSWNWEEKKYDAVILIFVNFATPNMRKSLFENCIATLKPGGILMLCGYRTEQLEYKTGGPPIFNHLYTEAMLKDAFSMLDILEMKSYDTLLHEGEGHNGLSALIGMVARKKN